MVGLATIGSNRLFLTAIPENDQTAVWKRQEEKLSSYLRMTTMVAMTGSLLFFGSGIIRYSLTA